MSKRNIRVTILVFILFITVGFLFAFIDDEWAMPEKTYELNMALRSNHQLKSIEKQTLEEVRKKIKKPYLGEIEWLISSEQELDNLSGTLVLKYYSFLGSDMGLECFGTESFDKYVICDVYIDLNQGKMLRMELYGNKQLGGGEEIVHYMDFVELKNILYQNESIAKLIDSSQDFQIRLTTNSIDTVVSGIFYSGKGERKIINNIRLLK